MLCLVGSNKGKKVKKNRLIVQKFIFANGVFFTDGVCRWQTLPLLPPIPAVTPAVNSSTWVAAGRLPAIPCSLIIHLVKESRGGARRTEEANAVDVSEEERVGGSSRLGSSSPVVNKSVTIRRQQVRHQPDNRGSKGGEFPSWSEDDCGSHITKLS
ncbi:hypothetical protein LXL04_007489 [Taraxacum kok-saghyz]